MTTDYQYALQHKYRLTHDGPFVPGVTTIINVLDKPGLKWASSGIGATTAIENARRKKTIVKRHREKLASARGKGDKVREKHELAEHGTDNEVYAHWCRAQFDVQWRAKANLGTQIHDIAERLTKGQGAGASDEQMGYVNAWFRFYEDHQPIFHYTESIVGGYTMGADSPEVYFAFMYGGRFDMICELRGRDQGLFLCDYKTGSEWTDTLALQMSGYMHAQLIEFDERGSIRGLEDLPDLNGARGIYLHADGTYAIRDPFEKIDEDDAWRAFSACNTAYATMKRINDALGKDDYE